MRQFKLSDEQWDALHAPISESAPSGESLRYEGTYDLIVESRRAERADLPQGVWEHSLKVADWEKVEKLCIDALTNKSKDLQITLWLTEAWFNRYGLHGFERGLTLLLGLTQKFWDTAHPELEDDDVDFRVAPFVWFNESLSPALRRIELTNPSHGEIGACTLGDWDGALRLDRLRVKDQRTYERAEEEGKITLERFLDSASKTKADFLRPRHELVLAVVNRIMELDAFLDEKLGRDGPSLRKVRDLALTAKSVLEDTVFSSAGVPLVEEPELPEPEEGDEEGADAPEAAAEGVPMQGGKVVIRSRDQAYELLEMVADYLQRVEPHSPTPYLIRRAVTWGEKSLIGVLQEFIEDPKQVEWISDVLGIRR